jgi:hypothetical protein
VLRENNYPEELAETSAKNKKLVTGDKDNLIKSVPGRDLFHPVQKGLQ